MRRWSKDEALAEWSASELVEPEVSAVFHVVLRGGPRLVDDEHTRRVDEADVDVTIERPTASGSTARFRISGEYEMVDDNERRVYAYSGDSENTRAASEA